ncbi:MAG: HAD-IA family hydrolase [Candidatus Lokiarchaeota archaeon]|nr:HAD-IA family hydrolase [Candidatus Lokiarchaeota archaeon]MBD3198501.1 HAD-IA family hydrolase [Candidatus Lokiarchaeota archaeon]
MKDNSLKAIVWDLDGTLIHFKINFVRARREAIKILRNKGISKKHLKISKSILENVRLSIPLFEEMGYNKPEIDGIIEQVDKAVREIEYEAALKASKIDGIEKVLEFAKNNNLKQAIYTYNTRKNAQVSLKKVNLISYFNVIVGRDNVDNPKPHKDHLLTICKELKLSPTEIVVIGDTYRDIEGALVVGARSIGIDTKISTFTTKDPFQDANIIIEYKDIPDNLIEAIKKIKTSL